MRRINLFLQSLVIFLMFSISSNAQVIRFFASKGATPGEKGFYLFDLNLKEGKFNLLSATDAGPNPSYFCISKKNGLIYAGNEMLNFKGKIGGGVTTLRYDAKTGVIEKIKEFSIPNGTPCFISLSPANDFLLLASYTGGSLAVVKLDDGGIPVSITDTVRFKSEGGKVSHAHMIAFNPAGNKVYLTDLGLDKLIIYNFD
ncbi:MAG TPA: beta-propeller fold lactonase family protein, partial [Bacteroidales bacterium]